MDYSQDPKTDPKYYVIDTDIVSHNNIYDSNDEFHNSDDDELE